MARVIPKRVLEDIRLRSDIVEVIGSYFNLRRAGSSFKALCPFHKEKTPSFHVNPQRQIFHCFGCGAGGDVFRFVMQYEGMDFTAAVRMLAQRAGVPLELEENHENGLDKNLLYQLHSEVAALYHHTLLENKEAAKAREYLAKRELTSQIIEEFMIGYAPDRWDAVLNWANKKKYRMEQLEKAGLIVKKSRTSGSGSDFYDRFRNRLMFPIFDEQSRVIGFSGRCLVENSDTAKYVNSPETPLFNKSRVLYALEKARRHIVDSREAIICEGQIDVIRCHQAGIKTAVAAQGTAFTEDHVRILKRYADSVCIVFDPDKAGQDAVIRAAVIFMQAELAIRVAVLPKGEDPDLFIRAHGTDAFQAILDKAASIIGYQIGVLSSRENAKSEIGVMRIAKAVLQTISHSPSAVQRAKLVQEAAERLNLPLSALQDDLRYMLRRSYQRSEVRDPAIGGINQRLAPPQAGSEVGGQRSEGGREGRAQPMEEVELCEHIVHITDCPDLGPLVEKYLPLDMVSDPLCRAVVRASLESLKSGRDIQHVLLDYDDPSGELQKFAAGVEMAPTKIVGREYTRVDAVKSLILRIWQRAFERERAELEKRLSTKPTRKEEDRRRQITYDLKALQNWEDGSTIIEIELSG